MHETPIDAVVHPDGGFFLLLKNLRKRKNFGPEVRFAEMM